MGKRNQCSFRTALLVFAIFSIVNTVVHVLAYFYGHLGVITDYALYAVKISLTILLYKSLNSDYLGNYKKLSWPLKFIFACDLLECYTYSLLSGNMGALVIIVVLTMIAKFILEFYFYLYIFKAEEDYFDYYYRNAKNSTTFINYCIIGWIVVNCLICALIFAELKVHSTALFAAILLLIASRFIVILLSVKRLKILKIEGPLEVKNIGELEDVSKKSILEFNIKNKKLVCVALCVVAVVLLALRFLYSSDKNNVVYEREGEYQVYTASNKLPAWTGCHEEKYGILSSESEEVTKAIYREIPNFYNNVAWEPGVGYIDVQGNVVAEAPFLYKLRRAKRSEYLCKAFDYLLDVDPDHDIYIKRYWDMEEYGDEYCEFTDGYGVISKSGDIVIYPNYWYVGMRKNYAIVRFKHSDKIEAINYDGKVLVKESGSVNILPDLIGYTDAANADALFYTVYDSDKQESEHKIISFNGQIVDCPEEWEKLNELDTPFLSYIYHVELDDAGRVISITVKDEEGEYKKILI